MNSLFQADELLADASVPNDILLYVTADIVSIRDNLAAAEVHNPYEESSMQERSSVVQQRIDALSSLDPTHLDGQFMR